MKELKGLHITKYDMMASNSVKDVLYIHYKINRIVSKTTTALPQQTHNRRHKRNRGTS